jgi:hypothetical protein
MQPQIKLANNRAKSETERQLIDWYDSTQDPFCILHCAGIQNKRKYEDLPLWALDRAMPLYTLYGFDLTLSNLRCHPDTYIGMSDIC